MYSTDAGESADFALIARRNSSLSSSGRRLAFAFILVVSLGIALAFAALGAWLILPFAGLEMLVLYWAFRHVARHAADYESLMIDGDRLVLESHELDRFRRVELNRCWAQVVMRRDGSRCHLALRSHGREFEFGRHLTERQRVELAGSLRRRLGDRR